MKTFLTAAATGIISAIVAALIVVAVDDNGGTVIIEQEPSAAVSQTIDAAPDQATPLPVAADRSDLESATVVEPEGAVASAVAALTAFDPERIFLDVSPSVVAVEVTLRGVGNGGGSGFFIDAEGRIVTNYHVVQGATQISVIDSDGNRTDARLLGFDIANDLAVIEIDPVQMSVTPVILADSDRVDVGEPVAAIGNPFGLQTSLTTGVVSAIERTRPGIGFGGRPQRGLIQTDTAINPGNSGGVLLNANGEVIGITASVESPVRGSVGVGFAIPSNTLARFLPLMLAGDEVLHAWIGIQGSFDASGGLIVSGVTAAGPADDAGIRPNDELLSADGETLQDFEQLAVYLDALTVGDVVEFSVDRGGSTITVNVELGAWPG